MYTDAMKRAFHAVQAPKGFSVQLIDNDHFLTVKLDERHFAGLLYEEKVAALQYVVQLKKALEMQGAIVLVTREVAK